MWEWSPKDSLDMWPGDITSAPCLPACKRAELTLSRGHYDVCSVLMIVVGLLGCNGACMVRRVLSVVLAMRLWRADEVIFHVVGDIGVN